MKKNILFLFILISSIYSFGQTIVGIDISHYQGTIDWDLVYADGKTFAWAKATQGTSFVDDKYVSNATNGTAAGVVMGAYHFAEPLNYSATDEAAHFLSIASPYIGPGFLPPVLDLEGNGPIGSMTSAELTAWTQEWMDYVENQTGIRPMLYTSPRYTNYLESSLNTYGLWIADPDGSIIPPNDIGNWTDWAFKQYSWTGSVSGINGDVDLDYFNGTIDDFNNLIGGGSTPPANDSCINAFMILSQEDCSYSYGTVNNATTDSNVGIASCDGFSGTPTAAGVFFKFTALTDSVQIETEPLNDLDAVVSLYEGTDCNNLTEIACSDNGGGAGQPEFLNPNNLTVGQTYWIRIYDYGSEAPTNGNFQICVTHANPEDITLSNVTVSPLTVGNGGTVNISLNQNYSGISTSLPNVNVRYFLSTDCVVGSDSYLGQDNSTINANNTTETETASLTIPSGTTPGTYYILFVADYTNVVDEINEDNNTECIQITVTSSDDIQSLSLKEKIKVYPNPVNNILNYKTDNSVHIKQIIITNQLGQIVKSTKILNNKIDVSSLTAGIYFVKFSDFDNNETVFKIIKY